jgi:hypothetical protein
VAELVVVRVVTAAESLVCTVEVTVLEVAVVILVFVVIGVVVAIVNVEDIVDSFVEDAEVGGVYGVHPIVFGTNALNCSPNSTSRLALLNVKQFS